MHSDPEILPESPAQSLAKEQAETSGESEQLLGNSQLPQDTLMPSSKREFGGRPGPDPTRYGDWEKNGRCIDF